MRVPCALLLCLVGLALAASPVRVCAASSASASVSTNQFITPQYILVHGYDAANQDAPSSFNQKMIDTILQAFNATPGSLATESRKFGFAYTFSTIRSATETIPIRESLQNLFALAVANSLPVMVCLDAFEWWAGRPDLWNHWNASQPGYDPANVANVEWSSWDPADANMLSWRNWGRQLRVLPQPNLASPAVLKAATDELRAIVPVITEWYQSLEESQRYLFAGIKVGWEISIGTNYYAYPNANALINADPTKDPIGGITETVQTGFNAVRTMGLASSGPLSRELLDAVVLQYVSQMTCLVTSLGIPQSKIFSHIGGDVADRPQNSTFYNSFLASMSRCATPGVSMYAYSYAPASVKNFADVLELLDGSTWGAVEGFYDSIHHLNGTALQQWSAYINDSLSTGNNRVMGLYNYDEIAANISAVQAIQAAVMAGSWSPLLDSVRVNASQSNGDGFWTLSWSPASDAAGSCPASEVQLTLYTSASFLTTATCMFVWPATQTSLAPGTYAYGFAPGRLAPVKATNSLDQSLLDVFPPSYTETFFIIVSEGCGQRVVSDMGRIDLASGDSADVDTSEAEALVDIKVAVLPNRSLHVDVPKKQTPRAPRSSSKRGSTAGWVRPEDPAVAVQLSLESTSVLTGTVPERYVSVTMDANQIPNHWQGIDFSDPGLRSMFSALSPSYLRVGGGEADYTTYNLPSQGGASLPHPAYSLMPQQLLSEADFDALNTFLLSDVGDWGLIFDLNLLQRSADGTWNSSNAQQLFDLIQSDPSKYAVVGYEVGNEPDGYSSHTPVTPQQDADAFHTVRQMVGDKPLMIGPDAAGSVEGYLGEYLQRMVTQYPGELDAVTIHHYYFYSLYANVSMAVSPSLLDTLQTYIDDVWSVVKASGWQGEVWFGETSNFYGGGLAAVSDRFVACFSWLDKLGMLALNGITGCFRQSVRGNQYALISDDLNPNPDLFATILWKRVMGQRVLKVAQKAVMDDASNAQQQERRDDSADAAADANPIRTYAHCTSPVPSPTLPAGIVSPGSVSFLVLNLNVNRTVNVSFDDASLPLGSTRVEWVMTSTLWNDESLPWDWAQQSRHVDLNGVTLKLGCEDGAMPSMQGRVSAYVAGDMMQVPPLSYAFIVFPQAKLTACGYVDEQQTDDSRLVADE